MKQIIGMHDLEAITVNAFFSFMTNKFHFYSHYSGIEFVFPKSPDVTLQLHR